MNELLPYSITCPHCWSAFDITIDPSGGNQEYYEDCPVCCASIELRVWMDDGGQFQAAVERGDG